MLRTEGKVTVIVKNKNKMCKSNPSCKIDTVQECFLAKISLRAKVTLHA